MKTEAQYQEWIKKVNQILSLTFSLDTDVFVDQPWRDWFDYGVSPQRAVERALSNEGY